jgi:hypothetical protein
MRNFKLNSIWMKNFILCSISFLILTSGILILSCGNSGEISTEETNQKIKLPPSSSSQQFNDYWYQGSAEIVTYELSQARYGELREGKAVQIFVTEPFNGDKQIKSDSQSPSNVNAFKMNLTRKFNTGIYPYSVMTSAFNVVNTEEPSALIKVTNSSQEWCGHSWSQLNRSAKGLDYQLFSYFESESDISKSFGTFKSEDGLWSQVRLNPSALPIGKVRLIPAMDFLRFRHIPAQPFPATGALMKNDSSWIYTLNYLNIRRTLNIEFASEFPHHILSWEEIYPSGFSAGADLMTTSAKAIHTEMLPYWQLNSVADSTYRTQIGLD